jgi:hypothetical protein
MQPKVFLHFEIVDHGEHMGNKALPRVPRASPGWQAGRRAASSFPMREATSTPSSRDLLQLKLRTDRITLRPLRHMLFRIKTRTVTMNHAQKERPEQSRYSVVDAIEQAS